MSEAKFSPGPWEVKVNGGEFLQIEAGQQRHVLACLGLAPAFDWDKSEADETNANARLIASAPEIYEALARIINILDGPGKGFLDWDTAIMEARAALAKARGDQPTAFVLKPSSRVFGPRPVEGS